jgi:release factor glutamine methyltransferase
LSAGGGREAHGPRTTGALLAAAAARLSASATPQLDAQLLLAATTGRTRSSVMAFPERPVGGYQIAAFELAVERRARGEPLAYITGEREFFSLPLRVTSDVLVPRPETELLVEELLARMPPAAQWRVLDLGTGSGAIALAVKHARPQAEVVAADASPAALEVARANGRRLGLEVSYRCSVWFEGLGAARYEAILCNPPYVRSDDPAFAAELRFEPRLALDGGADGLDAIRVVLGAAPRHLEPGGWLLLEHGFDQRPAVLALAASHGFGVLAVRNDLAGRPRVLVLEGPAA